MSNPAALWDLIPFGSVTTQTQTLQRNPTSAGTHEILTANKAKKEEFGLRSMFPFTHVKIEYC